MRRYHTAVKRYHDPLAAESSIRLIAKKLLPYRGMTLLEVVLVVAVLATLAIGSVNIYFNTIRSTEMETAVTGLMADLRYARGQAMSGADDQKWGLQIVNETSDYYEVFSTPTDYSNPAKVIDRTTYLPASVHFTVPAGTATILFGKITGTIPAEETITVANDVGNTKSIVVDTLGNVKKQ
jgi:prepilin-type N-terminal cleavage/methylation domain-containing protein